MMNWKRTYVLASSAALVLALAACATAGSDESAKTTVPIEDLHCALPTNCVSSLGASGMRPLSFVGSGAEAMAQLRATLKSFPEATVQGMTETTVVAVFTTPVGFRDTVEFRIDSTAHRIDFRSRSGFGLYDFGKNRARMMAFSDRFTHQLAR